MIKPIIKGLDTPIRVDLGKRLDYIDGNIIFECPSCGYEMEFLNDTADLEYGDFFGTDYCWGCGEDFEDMNFEVETTVTISIKEG